MSPAGGAGGGGGGAGAAGSGWGGAADSSMAVWPAQVHSGKAVSSLARLFLKTLSFWGVVVVTAGWWGGAGAWVSGSGGTGGVGRRGRLGGRSRWRSRDCSWRARRSSWARTLIVGATTDTCGGFRDREGLVTLPSMTTPEIALVGEASFTLTFPKAQEAVAYIWSEHNVGAAATEPYHARVVW